MGYGSNTADAYRLVGILSYRIRLAVASEAIASSFIVQSLILGNGNSQISARQPLRAATAGKIHFAPQLRLIRLLLMQQFRQLGDIRRGAPAHTIIASLALVYR